MTESDRVGAIVSKSDNFYFGCFHRSFKSTRSARRERENKMECLHRCGSATYLYQKFGC